MIKVGLISAATYGYMDAPRTPGSFHGTAFASAFNGYDPEKSKQYQWTFAAASRRMEGVQVTKVWDPHREWAEKLADVCSIPEVTETPEECTVDVDAVCIVDDGSAKQADYAIPAMEKGMKLANAKNFLSWTYEQPWMVMHELAHAYHHHFLDKGFENAEISESWTRITESKKYESVLHWNGKHSKHYALTNPMEYFAETTESYFGSNDFFPFVAAELKTFDPESDELMRKIWGDPQKRSGEAPVR